MNATVTLPDTARARGYFEDKMAFTTGPVELERELKSGDVVVVDVRAAEDFDKGHIPGAISLPQDRWEHPEGLDRHRVNVLYCYSQVCHLAARAAVELSGQGYPVRELEGGSEGCKQNKLPVEGAASRPAAKSAGAAPQNAGGGRSPRQENL
jgi:rhodanese-related sulfurtransferase